MILLAFSAGVLSAVLTWVLVGQLVRWAPKIGLVDQPNERSSHSRVTPRGGGIGIVASVVALGAAGLFIAGISEWRALAGLLGASMFIALISLWDDFRSLSAGLRFVCHFLGAAVVVALFGSLVRWELPSGLMIAWPEAVAFSLTLLWIVGLTNVYNFMDGIDGIAGVQGVVTGMAWALIGVQAGWPSVALLGAALAGSSLGFLGHNWSPAKIFMGDVSSAFLGFFFAALPVVAWHESAHSPVGVRFPIFAALVVWPFLGDGALTFIRRLLKREPVWKPHRSHLYQRLVQCGWSHARVSSLYGGWALACAALAFGWLRGTVWVGWIAVLFALGSLGAMHRFVTSCEKRKRVSEAK